MKKQEKDIVLAVFGSLYGRPYEELNKFLGSITIEEMNKLYLKLKYEDYCKSHGLKDYTQMSEFDFENFYNERNSFYTEKY